MPHRPRHICTGTLTVALPPERAFPLFTARGETLWVPGWSPEFVSDVDDDTQPGTVWRTRTHEHETTWIVVESRPPTAATYARVTPGHSATTVRVRLEATVTGSLVHVDYDLTSLDPSADALLEQFVAEYDDMLAEWQRLISDALPRLDER
ncbi:SRPBCC family protein [Microbacterium sp. 4R-513]|uniref:SRPBCC family protein n=1 Tax=Microbacterium sp. 4R-513 TaxID=2567934 RepID=UPI0013E158FB|nr:SRPBCC family protein [Microbacterium sp. 4R-513]QIG40753.1 SRPBCC family protein [Microbacterium sp. 4R-513]